MKYIHIYVSIYIYIYLLYRLSLDLLPTTPHMTTHRHTSQLVENWKHQLPAAKSHLSTKTSETKSLRPFRWEIFWCIDGSIWGSAAEIRLWNASAQPPRVLSPGCLRLARHLHMPLSCMPRCLCGGRVECSKFMQISFSFSIAPLSASPKAPLVPNWPEAIRHQLPRSCLTKQSLFQVGTSSSKKSKTLHFSCTSRQGDNSCTVYHISYS